MDIEKMISSMSLEEKAGMCSGQDFWHTKAVKRLGIPAVMVSDGPHGLRKQEMTTDNLGINDSIKAVCFPTGCTLAASFDREVLHKLGDTLGNECQAEDVSVILGPGVNMKRSPLCGRNFEYYSEDPYLSSELAANMIQGVQKHNVGTSIKHFFVNNQEHRRMSSSSNLDERTAREIYLASFEGAIKKGKPWTVMCSYNRINGTYSAENSKYLTDILRNEWGFEGLVVSDWGAVNNRVNDIKAGMDLEMPSANGRTDAKIVQAVKDGELKEEVLDQAVRRILTLIEKYTEHKDTNAVFDRDADHEIAKKMAAECLVLLKNDGLLPLDAKEKTAFIGQFAKKPHYQGGGSSHINSSKVESAFECCSNQDIIYATGYPLNEDVIHEDMIKEAKEAAANAKNVVIFAGLPDSFESEGFDRSHMRLPDCQNHLIEEVAKVNSNIVVVLHNGSPVEMPWINNVNAVVEAYLAGQGAGYATAQVLFGEVNPSGHLAETFPLKLEDNPSYLFYRGEVDQVDYREGVFIGYRYYDTKKMDVLFPFGHGLSYTTFEYSNLNIHMNRIISKYDMDQLDIKVTVDITNTGTRKGKAVPQVYVAPPKGEVIRPVHELREFAKVELMPCETKTVEFTLGNRAFAYYDMDLMDWFIDSGSYEIQIGESCRDIRVKDSINIEWMLKPTIITEDTIVMDLFKVPEIREVLNLVIKGYSQSMNSSEENNSLGEGTAEMMETMMKSMPLRKIIDFVLDMGYTKEAEMLQNLIS